MLPPATPLFTPTEAAFLTRLPLKAVNNAIDKKTIAAISGTRGGHTTRLLDLRALMSLSLERRTRGFPPELRREVFNALGNPPGNMVSIDDGFIKIDLREPRRELAASLRALRRARQLVVTDPETMGGEPVFKGTRIPVNLIATLIESGETEAELLASYPRLSAEMIRLAPIYAAAYPRRGRPRKQPWRQQPPVQVTRRKLADIGTA
jgi:uncharacterized protein (DUF433 family)